MKENGRDLRLMSVGDVLDYSFELFKRHFKNIALLALIFSVPFMFLSALISSKLLGDQLTYLKDLFVNLWNTGGIVDEVQPYTPDNTNIVLTLLNNLMMMASFAYWVTLKPVMDASIVRLIYDDAVGDKKRDDLKAVIKESFGKFANLFVNRIISSLILAAVAIGMVIAAVIFAIIVIGAGGAAVSYVNGIAGAVAILILVLGLILGCGLLVFYFTSKYYLFGVQSVVIEKKSATDALKRGSYLVNGSFWHILLSYIFGGLILYIFTNLLSTSTILSVFFGTNAFVIFFTIVQVVAAILDTFMTVLATILFINLKIKREGLDLEVKVDMLLEAQKQTADGEAPNA